MVVIEFDLDPHIHDLDVCGVIQCAVLPFIAIGPAEALKSACFEDLSGAPDPLATALSQDPANNENRNSGDESLPRHHFQH